jgi:hypothetical protein
MSRCGRAAEEKSRHAPEYRQREARGGEHDMDIRAAREPNGVDRAPGEREQADDRDEQPTATTLW